MVDPHRNGALLQGYHVAGAPLAAGLRCELGEGSRSLSSPQAAAVACARVRPMSYDRSVDVQILRLRRKLEANPSAPELIKTERGAGYVFTAPVQVL